MDQSVHQLEDLLRWLGSQREVAFFLGKQQRQIWGWLSGEHRLRVANRVVIADAWERVRRVAEQVGDDPAAVARVFSGPTRARAATPMLRALLPTTTMGTEGYENDADVTSDDAIESPGYFVPLEDYGARHSAGALARTRPLFALR